MTKVVLIRAFKKGEFLGPAGDWAAKLAANDLCMVKLVVGPGNPGPKDAPSTSPGIGMEIWLPSRASWNGRLHILGGGGYVGMGDISSPDQVAAGILLAPADVAGIEGAVAGITDGGHVAPGDQDHAVLDGSFEFKPDGSVNTALWRDLARRSTHELVLKTKVLSTAYYGRRPAYAYYDGCSQGGRQGLMEVQAYPDDFDGLLVGAPAIYWSRLGAALLYPQLVMQRDLGKPLSPAQLDLVSAAAVSACDTDLDGRHAGYISQPQNCRYNPLNDKNVLCATDGGANAAAACLTRKEAGAVLKIWFGPTVDGSAPAPENLVAGGPALEPGQIWFGVSRGTQLSGEWATANSVDGEAKPFPIGAAQIALALGDPKMATPILRNATGNGDDRWKDLSYQDLARAVDRGEAMRGELAGIETDKADVAPFRDHKGKLLLYHGMADPLIPGQGTLKYYRAMAARMGGISAIRNFSRLYMVPGLGHCVGLGSVNGLRGVSPPAEPPLPTFPQLYAALVNWVEKHIVPEEIMVSNRQGTVTRPLCAFPKTLKAKGKNRSAPVSYTCE